VADLLSGAIDIYSSTGALTGQIAGGCAGALAFDSVGRLYVGCGGIAVYEKQSPAARGPRNAGFH